MKNEKLRIGHRGLLIIVLSLFTNLIFSQGGFNFPEDLLVDPMDYELNQMNIKSIEQSGVLIYNKSSLRQHGNDTTLFIDYIITYDSLGRVSSCKYDFQEELFYPPTSNGPVNIFITDPDNQLVKKTTGSDTLYYSFCEYLFTYSYRDVIQIKLNIPLRSSITDGELLVTSLTYKLSTTFFYNEDQLIMKKEDYFNGSLYFTTEYFYKEFTNNSKTNTLLVKKIETYSSRRIEYDLIYTFFK
ncbi:MAG: hypothetical protein COA33_008115 [Fluviicola sp.]|nr:hypothetical protein [Fluviicola sp.]